MGPPLRPDGERLHRDALRELDRARRGVSVHLLRARGRDGARRTVPTPLVARRRAVLRRARVPLQLRLPVPDADGAAATGRPPGGRPRVCRQAGDRPGAAAGRGRHRLHERSERLRRRLRAEQANRLLEHAPRRQLRRRRGEDGARPRARAPLQQPPLRGHRLVRALRAARRLADRTAHAPPRRHGKPGRGTALAARDRRARSALAARLQRDLTAHGGGGGLEGARDHPPAGGGEEPLQAVHDPVAERPGPADVVVPPLRQPPLGRSSGSRWPRPGRRAAARSACTPARSRPRAG